MSAPRFHVTYRITPDDSRGIEAHAKDICIEEAQSPVEGVPGERHGRVRHEDSSPFLLHGPPYGLAQSEVRHLNDEVPVRTPRYVHMTPGQDVYQ